MVKPLLECTLDHGCSNHPGPQIMLRETWKLPKRRFKQEISPLKENDIGLHLLSCCTNQNINNLHEMVHTCKCRHNWRQNTIKNTIPLWLLPCTSYLPKCKCPAKLCPDILCILGTTPTYKPPCTPHPILKYNFLGLRTILIDSPHATTTRKPR